MFDLNIFVRAGELLRIGPWNAMGRAVRALKLISGPGVRLRQSTAGTIINFEGAKVFWNHPWKVTLNGDTAAAIQPGTINNIMPTIDGVELDGGEKGETPPVLEFTKIKLDKDGRGWIAAEITCDESWAVKKIEMVQVADLGSDDGKAPKDGTGGPPSLGGLPSLPNRRGRIPIAMLRQYSDGRLRVFQTTHFNLQHRSRFDSKNADVARHFFWAV